MELKKVSAFALGPILAAALGLITFPMIAWMFSPEDVGRLNVFQIATSFSLLLALLGLDQAYVREFHESSDRGSLFKACFLPGILFIFLAAIGSTPFAPLISSWLFGIEKPVFFWLTLAAIVFGYLSRFLSLILRMEERGLAFSMSQVLPRGLLLALIGVMALSDFRKQFLHLQLATVVSLLAVFLGYLWNTSRQWKSALVAPLNSSMLHAALRFGAPLILSGMAYWGLAATSIVALRAFSSFSEIGVYSISMSFAGIGLIFQAIFSTVWAPIVYKWVAMGGELGQVESVSRHVLAVVCGIFVMCGSFSWIIDYLLPNDYVQVKYLVLCCLAQPLFYTLSEVTCVGIGITRRTMLSLWSTLAALSVNVVLSLALVPRYGAAGAAISNATAFLIFFVARTEASAFVWRKLPRIRLYTTAISTTALAVITVIMGPSLPFHYSYMWLAVTPLMLWFFRVEWLEMVRYARNQFVRSTQESLPR